MRNYIRLIRQMGYKNVSAYLWYVTLSRIEAVKAAEDKKYVLMNAPADRLKEIIAVLPGMKSPTVMPLAQEGWCSVHTVLDEKCFWEIIGKLKALGAEGILVLPIEKMIV